MFRVIPAIAVAAFVACTPAAWARQSVVHLPGKPTGISAGGSVVVGGNVTTGVSRAFRLDSSGVTYLNEAAPVFGAGAAGISPDGAYVVGSDTNLREYCGGSSDTNFPTAALWLAGSDPLDLGLLPGDNTSYGVGVSDNAVVFGISAFGENATLFCSYSRRGFVWSAANGMTAILPVDSLTSMFAAGISADGSRVVGTGTIQGQSFSRAFVWTASQGASLLPPAPGFSSESEATDISDNGLYIVGSSGGHASMWTADGSPELFRVFTDGVEAIRGVATYVSGDGSFVIGTAEVPNGFNPPRTRAFVWDRVRGMRELRAALTGDYGVSLKGLPSFAVVGLSRTGRFIIASVRNGFPNDGLLIDLGRAGACIADRNLDGIVNSNDFFDFLGGFFAGTADINEDGATDSQDFFDFLGAFFAGC